MTEAVPADNHNERFAEEGRQRAIELTEAHWEATRADATEEAIQCFRKLLYEAVEVNPVASPEQAARESDSYKGQVASRFTLPADRAEEHNAQLSRIRDQLGR